MCSLFDLVDPQHGFGQSNLNLDFYREDLWLPDFSFSGTFLKTVSPTVSRVHL